MPTTKQNRPKRLLVSLPDAFHMLGVSKTKGFSLVSEGVIETTIVGKRRMARVASLEAIANGKVSSERVA